MSQSTMLGLTIFLAFAPAALAVDGTVLINQSTITNGLTGCPTGGHFPIVICQSGSYRLSGNVTVPDANTDAIHINSDNVALDLNGFAIQGPATCTIGTIPLLQCSAAGTGVGISSFNTSITLINGAINGMGRAGIVLYLAVGARIDGMRIANNAGNSSSNPFDFTQAGGGILTTSGIITNCMVTTNAQYGIYNIGSGTVSQNNISFNGGIGIASEQGIGSVVASNNSVSKNGQDGINNVLLAVNNTLVNNIGFALSCFDSSCGYEGNVIQTSGVAFRGKSLGQNLSNGSIF